MSDLDKMLKMAEDAMENAYCPYSKFQVGAVIKTSKGNFYSGCNVENAAYPVGSCAEQSAISQMIANGEKNIQEILIMGKSKEPVTPCGACRQRIREFGTENTIIYACEPNKVLLKTTLKELLPHSFGPENLS